MKKLLVHLHIFNHDQTEYFISKLNNISDCEWDLYVTFSFRCQETEDKIRQFKENAVFTEMGNIGYDVWPFIRIVKLVDLMQYDYILKLHTKSGRIPGVTINGMLYNGNEWRDELVNSLLADRQHFSRLIKILDDNGKIGFICSDNLYFNSSWLGFPEDGTMLDKEMKRLNMKCRNKRFCAGTMFLARAGIYGFLKNETISEDMFRGEVSSASLGSMAHVYERILSIASAAQSYRTHTVVTDRTTFVKKRLKEAVKFIFSITRSKTDRMKYLTVAGCSFKISGPKKEKQEKPAGEIAVVVPVYKNSLDPNEEKSLAQVFKILAGYKIIAAAPESLDTGGTYGRFPFYSFERFDDNFFKGIRGYNKLVLSHGFYERFSDFSYILIYQLDAYVFFDCLREWAAEGYDFIGAPWIPTKTKYFTLAGLLALAFNRIFRKNDGTRPHNTFLFRVGNGGFSLRKTETFKDITSRYEEQIGKDLDDGKPFYPEDLWLYYELPRQTLKKPGWKKALYFAYEQNPEKAFKINRRVLPFGCHAWYHHDYAGFWEKWI